MRTESESSFIEHFTYDHETRVLHVKVRGGQRYGYADVPEDVHEAFVQADSHGKFFNRHIRGVFKPL